MSDNYTLRNNSKNYDQKLNLTDAYLYSFRELNYRNLHTIIGSTSFFLFSFTYKQGLIFITIPKGLSHFISTKLTDMLYAYINFSTVVSIGLLIIVAMIQLFFFFYPGLFAYETKEAFLVFFFVFPLFLAMYLKLLFPLIKLSWDVFTDYTKKFDPIKLDFEPRLNDYLYHIYGLTQIAALITLVGLITYFSNVLLGGEACLVFRKSFTISLLCFSALVTPADLTSHVCLVLPAFLFFEILTGFAVFFGLYKRRTRGLTR